MFCTWFSRHRTANLTGYALQRDMGAKRKIKAIELDLKLMEKASADMVALNQDLISRAKKSSDKLQAVHKKLFKVSISKMLSDFVCEYL
ncbi:hypothetical protein CFP56_022177 [Quercus suber]|uniref:Uncharacterized protein n=1 Tax=Quercus suber TaxID=58331 RepID=A0AAW0KBH1_QUESU